LKCGMHAAPEMMIHNTSKDQHYLHYSPRPPSSTHTRTASFYTRLTLSSTVMTESAACSNPDAWRKITVCSYLPDDTASHAQHSELQTHRLSYASPSDLPDGVLLRRYGSRLILCRRPVRISISTASSRIPSPFNVNIRTGR
jgi:hypothetical protein